METLNNLRADFWDKIKLNVWDKIELNVGGEGLDNVKANLKINIWAKVWWSVVSKIGCEITLNIFDQSSQISRK